MACPECSALSDGDARFCSRCGAPLGQRGRHRGYLPTDLTERFLGPGVKTEGQLRRVTVVFADLVRSTEVMRAIGGERMAELLDDVLQAIARSVDRFEGTIIDLAGDGALCVFGAPVTHEDDTERALRAATEIVAAVRESSERYAGAHAGRLAVRVGIHTGDVVLRALGGAYRLKYSVVGDAVHMAQRLQSAAGPHEILVSDSTRRAAPTLFRFGPERTVEAKGFTEDLVAAPLLAVREAEDTRPSSRSTFIGREAERALLRGRFDLLAKGMGGVVTISGDAGIGKTRLVSEARHEIPAGAIWLRGRALSYEQDVPYRLIGDLTRRTARITGEDSEQVARVKIREMVMRECGDRASLIHPFVAFALGLGLDEPDREVVSRHGGDQLQREIRRAFRELIAGFAGRAPVVLVLEDLHWVDQASLGVIEDVLRLTDDTALLVLLVARPDRAAPSWPLFQSIATQFPRQAEISLRPLSTAESRALACAVLEADRLPADFGDALLPKTEGVPLFVEEFVRALVEDGTLGRKGVRWELTVPVDRVRAPDTVQGVILSRIDRLDDRAKHVLQVSSVIGRVFPYRVLEEVLRDEDDLIGQLRALQRQELLREARRLPDLEFSFHHVLVQEVAYGTLLARRRRELHGRVAEAMERVLADRLGEARAIVGEHYFRAEAWEPAAAHLLAAGNAATAIAAYAEARLHYAKALTALAKLPDSTEHRTRQVDATLLWAHVAAVAEDPRAGLERLAEAERIAEVLSASGADEDALRLGRVRFWVGRLHFYGGDPSSAVVYLRRALAVARELGDEHLEGLSSGALSRTLIFQGRVGEGLPLLEREAARLARTEDWAEWARIVGYLGIAYTWRGDYPRGRAEGERALARALAEGNLTAIGSCHNHLSVIHLFGGDTTRVLAEARSTLDAAERSGDQVVAWSGHLFMAWAESKLGRHEEAIVTMGRARELGERLAGGRLILDDLFSVCDAEIALNAGRHGDAIRTAESAAIVGSRRGSLLSEGLAHRIWALALARGSGKVTDAERHLKLSYELLQAGECVVEAERTRAAMHEVTSRAREGLRA